MERDFKGRVIDGNPLKQGEPTQREKDGRTEYWCGTCPNGGHWGNHDDKGHDKFLEKRKKWRENQKKKKEEAASSEGATSSGGNTSPPSMHGTANFCRPVLSFLTGSTTAFEDDASF